MIFDSSKHSFFFRVEQNRILVSNKKGERWYDIVELLNTDLETVQFAIEKVRNTSFGETYQNAAFIHRAIEAEFELREQKNCHNAGPGEAVIISFDNGE